MKRNILILLGLFLMATGCDNTDDAVDTTTEADSGTGGESGDFPGYDMTSDTLDGVGGAIAYDKWEYTAGDAQATLVFATGRTEYTDKYHHLIEMIDRPWNIVMFDHFGQGRSDGPRAHTDGFDMQLTANMKTVIDELADPNLPVLVVAHSMGGFVATRLAQLYPDIASAFVLSSPMYDIPTGGVPEDIVANMIASNMESGNAEEHYQAASPRSECADNAVTHDCELYEQFKDDEITLIGEPTWGWLDSFYTKRDEMVAQAENITAPFLILQAGEETVVIPEKHQELCTAIDNGEGTCEIEIFADDYHELFNEIDRQAVMESTLTFLDANL